MTLLIASASGLFRLADDDLVPLPGFGERDVTALDVRDGEVWAVAERRTLVRGDLTGESAEATTSDDMELTCLLAGPEGVLLGTEEAHLLTLDDRSLVRVESFEAAEGRDAWYTPWGGPPAVRSIARDLGGRIHANVHVGGIPRSLDGGRMWEPTIDIDADVHQVVAHPAEPDVVLAAGAVGLAVSLDGGATWRIEGDGLPSTYARAVAVAGDVILLSASNGPRGGRAGIYRARLGAEMRFEKCSDGLPEWFDGNVDTGWLVADDHDAAFATDDGDLFLSEDAGEHWWRAGEGLPAVRWLAFG